MRKYIRFGEIPPGERSVNFIKMTLDQAEDFSVALEIEGPKVYEYEEFRPFLENGVSAFDCVNGLPKIDSLELATSLSARLVEPAFLVEAEEVGRGRDNEPLVKNIKVIKKINVSVEKLSDVIFNYLNKNYVKDSGEREESIERLFIFWDHISFHGIRYRDKK